MQARVWRRLGFNFASGANFEFSYPIDPDSNNNEMEYLALLKGIQLLREVKADTIEIFGDSRLVVNQLISRYKCNNDTFVSVITPVPSSICG